jgi:hypothetical protein
MHGVNPDFPSQPHHVDIIREYLPLIGFALIPFVGLSIATAIQARGFPTLKALTEVVTLVGTTGDRF